MIVLNIFNHSMEESNEIIEFNIRQTQDKSPLEELLCYCEENKILFCLDCKSTPLIEFFNLYFARVKCKCNKKREKFNCDEIIKNFLIDIDINDNNELIQEYIKCNIKHQYYDNGVDKKFRYYCDNCEKNMCKLCTHKHECPIRYRKDFKKYENDIKEKINYIADILISKQLDVDLNSSIYMEPCLQLKILIATICKQYKEFPNNNIFDNINNIYSIITKIKPKEKSDNELNNNIEIYNSFDLSKAKKKKKERDITKIKINKKDFNILRLKKALQNLTSLKILDLQNNFIANITFLTNVKLNNLEELYLNTNHLDDSQINNIKKLEFENLIIMELGTNIFKSFEIFTLFDNFQKIKVLGLESNPIKKNFSGYKNHSINCHSIEKLDLSNGSFSTEIIDLISCFRFENLKILDMSSNNIESLSFIKLINFGTKTNTIEKLILNNNDISICQEDLDYLISHYINLKSLELKDNCSSKYNIKDNLPFEIQLFDNENNDNSSINSEEEEMSINEYNELVNNLDNCLE